MRSLCEWQAHRLTENVTFLCSMQCSELDCMGECVIILHYSLWRQVRGAIASGSEEWVSYNIHNVEA